MIALAGWVYRMLPRELVPTEDRSAALRRFQAGELDTNNDAPTEQVDFMRDELGDQFRVAPYLGTYYYALNHEDENLAKPEVRQALSMAIDREFLADEIWGSTMVAGYSFIPPGIGNYGEPAYADYKDMSQIDREEKALELLEAAGYGPDHPLRLTLNYNTLEDHKKIAVAVAAMWKPLGVEVALVNSEAAVHYATIRQGKFEVARYGMVATINDPFDFLGAYAKDGSASRASGYHDADYDALVARSTRELDPQTRQRTMTQAQQRLLDDYALLPLYDYVSVHLVSPRLGGWESNPMDVHPLRYLEERD